MSHHTDLAKEAQTRPRQTETATTHVLFFLLALMWLLTQGVRFPKGLKPFKFHAFSLFCMRLRSRATRPCVSFSFTQRKTARTPSPASFGPTVLGRNYLIAQ